AMQAGTYDEGMQTLKAVSTKIMREVPVYTDPATKAVTKYIELERTLATEKYDFQDTKKMSELASQGFDSYYHDVISDKVFAMFNRGSRTETLTGRIIPSALRIGPTTRFYPTNVNDIRSGYDHRGNKRWVKIDVEKAAKLWQEESDKAPSTYTNEVHLITGAVLPIWDKLPLEEKVEVARTQTTDGTRLLGLKLNKSNLEETLKRIGVGSQWAEATPQELMSLILDKDKRLVLSNGWVVKRVIVNKEPRIEIKAAQQFYTGEKEQLKKFGIFFEGIAFRDRAFIPTDKPEVLEKLLGQHSLTNVVSKKGEDEALLSRLEARGRGMTLRQGEALLEPIKQAWKGVGIHLVLHESQIPGEFSAEGLRIEGATVGHITEGIYTGQIYIVLRNIHTIERFYEVVAHEAIGHAAMQDMLGPELFALVVRQIHTLDALGNPLVRELGREVDRRQPNITRDQRAKEIIALMAERGLHNKIPLWTRIVEAIRTFLRSLGFQNKWVTGLTEQNILKLLQAAEQYLEGGMTNYRGGHAAFASVAPPPFYSQLSRVVAAKMGNKEMPLEIGAKLNAWAQNGLFKKDELQWSGVLDWLKLQK
ncbi:MAG: hypothetical protein ACRD2L_05560, partial [Terriglobia bacterium]